MDQQKLPNVTIALVMAILGFVCCCFAGIPGIIFGGIGLFLVNSDEKKYQVNPEGYSNYSQLKTAKTLAWVVFGIGVAYFLWNVYSIYQMGGIEGYMEKVNEAMEQYGIEQ